MSRDEFEAGYAERSRVTVEWLHANGQFGVPCDCDDEQCRGWQMAHVTEEEARALNDAFVHIENS